MPGSPHSGAPVCEDEGNSTFMAALPAVALCWGGAEARPLCEGPGVWSHFLSCRRIRHKSAKAPGQCNQRKQRSPVL